MLYVALFRTERARDLEFWSVLWQGGKPPADFELVAAYNLLTDLRVIVFKAESIAAIRWIDRLNLVGKVECFPTLDQTEGYHMAVNRDFDGFAAFLRGRGAPEPAITRAVGFRRESMQQPDLWAALRFGKAYGQGTAGEGGGN